MDTIKVDIRSLVKFIEEQMEILKVKPASDYSNGVLEGMTMIMTYINKGGERK